jgi:hypothetical protein
MINRPWPSSGAGAGVGCGIDVPGAEAQGCAAPNLYQLVVIQLDLSNALFFPAVLQ